MATPAALHLAEQVAKSRSVAKEIQAMRSSHSPAPDNSKATKQGSAWASRISAKDSISRPRAQMAAA